MSGPGLQPLSDPAHTAAIGPGAAGEVGETGRVLAPGRLVGGGNPAAGWVGVLGKGGVGDDAIPLVGWIARPAVAAASFGAAGRVADDVVGDVAVCGGDDQVGGGRHPARHGVDGFSSAAGDV